MGARIRDEDGLTFPERKFVVGYLQTLDGKHAQTASGVAMPSAHSMFRRPHVKAAIQKELDHHMEAFRMNGVAILRTLLHRATYDPREFVHEDGTPKGVHELSDSAALAAEVRVQDVTMWDPDEHKHVVRRLVQIRTAPKEQAIDKLLRVLQLMDGESHLTVKEPLQLVLTRTEDAL